MSQLKNREIKNLNHLGIIDEIGIVEMLMGLCLLVYSLGQRQIRTSLQTAKTGIQNQLGKLTERPTLRWIFQCFQGIHLVEFEGIKQIANLTEKRQFTGELFFLILSKILYFIWVVIKVLITLK
jgi:transposase